MGNIIQLKRLKYKFRDENKNGSKGKRKKGRGERSFYGREREKERRKFGVRREIEKKFSIGSDRGRIRGEAEWRRACASVGGRAWALRSSW